MARGAILIAVLVASLGGCGLGGGARGNARTAESVGPPAAEVPEEAFASTVRELLLSEPGSARRAQLLGGVEARQMSRAVARFKAKKTQRGLIAAVGGLYLVRTGELKPGMLGASGYEAMKSVAREMSQQGDEGRARASFEILSRIAPEADKAEIAGHLQALGAWTRDSVAKGGPVAAAGALENVAVTRRLVEPSESAREEAVGKTIDWIEKALALRSAYRAKHVPPPREEAAEALRALGSGATVLAALYVRDGDVKSALRALDRVQGRDLAKGEVVHALESISEKADAEAWLELVHALRSPPSQQGGGQDEEAPEDHEVLRAASFTAAFEAFRTDPTTPESAGAVAAALEELGMAEASPAVLGDAVKAHPDPRIVSGALAITMHAMRSELESDDIEAARRAYAAGAPLLAVADEKAYAGKLSPSAAGVRAMMGNVELAEGRLEQARALLRTAAGAEKAGGVNLALARIERHDGKIAAALEQLREGLAAPDTARDPALRGEILLTISDITLEQGDVPSARTPLTEALKGLVSARKTPDGEDRARVERVLSRVLDRFGATQPAQRALERALEAAPHDKRQAAATIGQLVGRAFVKGDLKAAREGLQRGLASELETEDIVYYALWVRLLERQLRTTTDGTAERIFQGALEGGRWINKLAAFGAGLVKAEELARAAQTPAQKTEALFYAAMDRRASGDAKGADDALREVMRAGGIDLMEVAIAREILSGPRGAVGGPLPTGVAVP
jgi:tetratricopeptide (TPR) repeat protein